MILPEISSTGEIYICVLVDLTYINQVTCLITKTPDFVISSLLLDGETG